MLVDRFGRFISNLRISVTKMCNYSCFYCHKEGVESFGESKVLTPDDIGFLVSTFSMFGPLDVKFTGGEPLLREDICDIVAAAKDGGAREVSLVTNGYLLKNFCRGLRSAGLDRVNVSLPTLNPRKYAKITGVDGFDNVVEGINQALECGLSVKINVVVLRGINDVEIPDFISFAIEKQVPLQLIELEPVGFGKRSFEKYYRNLDDVERYLAKRASRIETRENMHNRKRYYLNENVYVELVRPYKNPAFCMHCRRLRVTPDGKLKLCLLTSDEIDAYEAIKRRDTKALINTIRDALLKKQPYYVLH